VLSGVIENGVEAGRADTAATDAASATTRVFIDISSRFKARVGQSAADLNEE
jgi:hypothetical protein